MTSRWPLALPQYPLREGLDVEPLDTDVRGETDTGPGTVRAAELGEWNKVRCTVALRSREERDRLLQWHRDDLVGGTQEFDWPELDASVGDLSYRYLFTAKPKRVPRGVQGWRMALELMTLPAPPPVDWVRDGEISTSVTTFARNSAAHSYGADLLLHIAGVNVPRVSYDPDTGKKLGVLIEPQATNLLSQPNNFSGSAWTQYAGVVFSPGAVVGPDGGQSGNSIDASPAGARVAQRVPPSTSALSVSIFAMQDPRDTRPYGLIARHGAVIVNERFDLKAGEWRRVSARSDFFADNPNTPNVYVVNTRDAPQSAEFLFAFGMQAEYGDVVTSYIPPGNNASTRAPDFLDAPAGPWYMPGEATILGAVHASRDPGQPVCLATADRRIYQEAGQLLLDGPGELVCDRDIWEGNQLVERGTYAPGELIRFRYLCDAPDVDKWTIGRDYDDSHWWNSHVLDMAFIERRISIAQAVRELAA